MEQRNVSEVAQIIPTSKEKMVSLLITLRYKSGSLTLTITKDQADGSLGKVCAMNAWEIELNPTTHVNNLELMASACSLTADL